MALTREAMIEKVSEISEEDNADVVGYYLDNAEEIILNRLYPYDEQEEMRNEGVPAKYRNLQMRIAVGLLAKRGAEFEATRIENGVHRHFGAEDVPASVLREITPKAVFW